MPADQPNEERDPRPWWVDTVGYEVYLRSFADGNGDGIGDLIGLRSRLDHLADIGVECVWVTPCFPSPMADFGYDVADYCDIHPDFGTLADLDALVAAVHERGMRIILDLVPNHTSDQHPWFQAALAGDADARARYLFRDPGPDGGPPNNWRSHFGGPAWTFDETSGQWYLHLFLPEQPDLDWRNETVRAAFDDIIDFWLDRGVDGFRIDVAQGQTKDPALRDNPILEDVPDDAAPRTWFWAMDHVHDLDQDDNLDVYRRWHARTEPRDAVLLGEVYLRTPDAVARYVEGGDGLDAAFYFPVLHQPWDVDALRRVVDDACAHGGGRFAWVHSSHDDPRAPTRFGGGATGRRRALAFQAFTAFLPGPFFLYQGDELGLENGHVAPEHRSDPVAVRNDDPSDGRDPVRTPIPWAPDEPNLGFSTGEPWIPVAPNHGPADTVAAQRDDPDSPLTAMRDLLAARRRTIADLGLRTDDVTEAVAAGPHGIARRRGPLLLVLAVGGPVELDDDAVPGLRGATVVHAVGEAELGDGRLTVGTDGCAVVHVRDGAAP